MANRTLAEMEQRMRDKRGRQQFMREERFKMPDESRVVHVYVCRKSKSV
tara:strand:- start:2162 stop:2308 length:147 start_codon:yes stop_codon:yes gene_type:complete